MSDLFDMGLSDAILTIYFIENVVAVVVGILFIVYRKQIFRFIQEWTDECNSKIGGNK